MKTAKDIRFYIYLAACALGVFLLLPVLFRFIAPAPAYPVTELTGEWYVERGEMNMEGVPRTGIITTPILAGESVLVSHTLPDETVPDACVLLVTEHALMRAYVGGVQVYSYEDFEPGVLTPVEAHLIRMPEDYAGKELSVVLIAAENNAFQVLQPVFTGNHDDLNALQYSRQTYGTLYGVFLVCYGLMLFVLSIYLARYVKRNLRILFSALISLFGGIAVLGASGFFTYAFYDPVVNNVIGLVALYLIPAAVTGLFVSLRQGLVRKAFIAVTIFNVMWAILTFILYSSPDRYVPLSFHLTFFRRLVIAETVLAAALFAYDYFLFLKKGTDFFVRIDARRAPLAEIALFTGACVLTGVTCLDVLFLRGFAGQRVDGVFGSGVTLPMLGLLFFDACVIQNYFIFAAEHLGETNRNRKLNEIAYSDPLTGLSNRAHCELMMRELDETNANFSMVNMDVNGLKIINDTLGHSEGDRFLKGFGQILKIFFKNADLVGRMGGDEFVVILKDIGLLEAKDRMDALTALLYKMNKSESTFKYEASYGVADSREIAIGKKSAEVYRLADERMYEMKREVHARRGGNGRD